MAPDNTKRGYHSSSRSLNYASGGTIQRAERQEVTVVPRTLNYKDTVGLFGSENHFVRVQMNLDGIALDCFEEPGWRARISDGNARHRRVHSVKDQLAVIDFAKDTPEDVEFWYDTTSESGWDDLLEKSPETDLPNEDYMKEDNLALIDQSLDTQERSNVWMVCSRRTVLTC